MNNRRLLLGVTFVLFGLLALYAVIGLFARGLIDDLCLAARGNQYGILQTVSTQYWRWSGNVVGLLFQVGGATLRLYQINPLLQILLWTATFAWLIWEMFARLDIPRSRPLVIGLGALCTLVLLDMSPNIGQTLYWLNGTANYGPTAALFVMLLTLIIRVSRLGLRRIHLVAAVLLTLLSVLGQITLVLYCIGILVPLLLIALAVPRLPQRDGLLRLLLVALATALPCALVVMLTPGNAIRQQVIESAGAVSPGFVGAVLANIPQSLWLMVITTLVLAPVAHLVLFGAGCLAGLTLRPAALRERALSRRVRWLTLAAMFSAGFIVFYLGQFAATYAGNQPVPPRGWIVPQSGWVVILACAGYIVGLTLRPLSPARMQRVRMAAIALFVGYVALTLVHLVPFGVFFSEFAQDFDDRVALVEAAKARGELDVMVPPYRHATEDWLKMEVVGETICTANYQQVNSVTVE